MTPPPHPLVFAIIRGLLKERRLDAWQDYGQIISKLTGEAHPSRRRTIRHLDKMLKMTGADADTIRGLKHAGEVWVEVHHLYKGSSQDWFQGEVGREPTGNELGIIDEIVKEGNDALGVK